MNHVSHNKGKKFPAEPLNYDEIMSILKVCSKRAKTGKRDRALIIILWRGQLRINEALSLKPADFNPEECTLRVLFGKRKRARVVAIDRETSAELSAWLAYRESLGMNGHQTIFCTLAGNRLADANVRQMLPRRARKAGITKRVHPHGFRHTGASELAAEGVNLRDIQDQLGHGSLQTTNVYIHTLNPVSRAKTMRERKWTGDAIDTKAELRKKEIAELKERLDKLEQSL